MSEALPLPGLEPPLKLSERQAQALRFIRAHGPLSNEELGRRLRELRGGSPAAEQWDTSAGRAVAESLKGWSLVRLVRVDGRMGWVDVDWREPLAEGAYDPRSSEIPF